MIHGIPQALTGCVMPPAAMPLANEIKQLVPALLQSAQIDVSVCAADVAQHMSLCMPPEMAG